MDYLLLFMILMAIVLALMPACSRGERRLQNELKAAERYCRSLAVTKEKNRA